MQDLLVRLRPRQGDAQWQVPPGTPFAALPAHWACPQCEGRAEQFMVIDSA
jgi:rubredoxin